MYVIIKEKLCLRNKKENLSLCVYGPKTLQQHGRRCLFWRIANDLWQMGQNMQITGHDPLITLIYQKEKEKNKNTRW